LKIICKSAEVEAENAWDVKVDIKSFESVKFDTERESDDVLDTIGKEYVKAYFNLVEEE
jgi:hypothetical protein